MFPSYVVIALRRLPGVSGTLIPTVSQWNRPRMRFYRGNSKPKFSSLRMSPRHQFQNPGIQRRLEVLKENTPDEVSEEEAAEFDEMETDFTDIHHAYDDHQSEMQEKKEILRQQIVSRQYFKINEPNLLTWQEKQQIKYLHKTDPDKWTIEALSQCFPVTELGIKRILKSEWKPLCSDRLIRHNESVKNNWKLLREGKLDVPKDLRASFLQFSSRAQVVLSEKDAHSLIPPTNSSIVTKSTEFTNLVKTSNSPKPLEHEVTHNASPHTPADEETFVLGNARRGPHMTIDAFREKTLKMKHLSLEAQDLLKDFSPKPGPAALPVDPTQVVEKEKVPPAKIPLLQAKLPERINIPAKLRGKASLYRLEDCYYDTDGAFLYRVPGMKI